MIKYRYKAYQEKRRELALRSSATCLWKQGAKSSKMASILKDKVKYITEQSFRNGKDFFYE